jgi:hypothetical protein
VEEGPGGGAEGGTRRGHDYGHTPSGERNSPGPPKPAGHPLKVDQGKEDVEDP